MIAVETAHFVAGIDGGGQRLDGLRDLGANLGADRFRRIQVLVVAAVIQRAENAEQNFAGFQIDLGSVLGKPRRSRQDKQQRARCSLKPKTQEKPPQRLGRMAVCQIILRVEGREGQTELRGP
jgi:hypothetical protein